MRSNILRFGLISGSIIVGIPVLTGIVVGYGPETFKLGEIIGYSTIVLSLLVIFLAVKEYQKSHPEEQVGFVKVLQIGTGISAIAGIMFGIYNLIYVTYISPEFMQQYYEYYIDNIRNSGMSEQDINLKISQMESEKAMFMNPVINFFAMFATVFIAGLIISIISGFFYRERDLQVSK